MRTLMPVEEHRYVFFIRCTPYTCKDVHLMYTEVYTLFIIDTYIFFKDMPVFLHKQDRAAPERPQ